MPLMLLYPWALEILDVLGQHPVVVVVCVCEEERLRLRGAKVGEVVGKYLKIRLFVLTLCS